MKLKVEQLEDRWNPTNMILGDYGYVSVASPSATISQLSLSRWNISTSDQVIIYTPFYCQSVFSANSGVVLLSGFEIDVTAGSCYVYCTGGTVQWTGDSAVESAVNVIGNYSNIVAPTYFLSFIGNDTVSFNAGIGGGTFDFYGSVWNERLDMVNANSFTVTHRDGVNSFSGFNGNKIFRSNGGADVYFQNSVPSTGYYLFGGFQTQDALFGMSVQALLSLSVSTTGLTGWDLTKTLRNYVTSNLSIGSNSSSWLSLTPKERFFKSFVLRTEPVICGGASILYNELLSLYGIKSRIVYLFASDGINGHSSVEANISSAWSVSDPTYNICVKNQSGVRIDYATMKITNGWVFDMEGFSGRWRFNIATYPIPYSAYLYNISYSI